MDDYDKGYELRKLEREINKYMDGNSLEPEAMERYEALLAEINKRKEDGVKMTETELEILQKQFNLEQARDAYQDARAQKNTMRLARDASGNWSYVYSSEAGAAEDADQKIEDALYNIHKLHREAADEMGELWLQTQQELFEYEQNIDWALYENDAKYKAEVDQRLKWYEEQLELYAKYFAYHNDAIGRSQEDTVLGIIANTNDLEETDRQYNEWHNQLVGDLKDNYWDWRTAADEARMAITGSTEDLQSAIQTETQKMRDDYDLTAKEVEKLKNKNNTYLDEMLRKTSSWAAETTRYYDEVIKKIREYQNMIQATVSEKAGEYDSGTHYLDLIATKTYEHFKGNTGVSEQEVLDWLQSNDYMRGLVEERNKAAKARGLDTMTAEELAAQIVKDFASEYYFYDNQWNYGGKQSTHTSDKDYNTGGDYSINFRTAYERYREKNPNGTINGFLSTTEGKNMVFERYKKYVQLNGSGKGWEGGNTEAEMLEWAKDHLAELFAETASGGLITTPQIRSLAEEGPELVLNADDTKNILATVKNMRELIAEKALTINTRALGATAVETATSAAQLIDQNVKIEATFPGVSVAAEVEEALNNLLIQVAQYNIKK